MHRLFLVLPLLSALVACEAEPEVGDLSPAEVDELLLTDGLKNVLGVVGIEWCNDNKDNDGDGLVDGQDPDCSNGGHGGLGFTGDILDGTNIYGNPLEKGEMKTLDGSILVVAYDPGLPEKGVPAEVRLTDRETGALTVVQLSSGAQVEYVDSAQRKGDRAPGLVIGLTKESGAYYAEGPIGDTLYVEKR